jgi:hypothetical protein
MTIAQQLTQAASKLALADLTATSKQVRHRVQERLVVELMQLPGGVHQHGELIVSKGKRRRIERSRHVRLAKHRRSIAHAV